jgi:hypothetical protein
MKPHGSLSFVIGVVLLAHLSLPCAQAQQILQVLEPGIGYARFKQWTVESQLVFENFTKDSLVVRDTGLREWETTGSSTLLRWRRLQWKSIKYCHSAAL